MAAVVTINGKEVETSTLASFAFAYHTSDPGHPQYEEGALLRIDYTSGDSTISKGGEAVVLKVLLASLGVRDLSKEWESEPDPRTIPPASERATP